MPAETTKLIKNIILTGLFLIAVVVLVAIPAQAMLSYHVHDGPVLYADHWLALAVLLFSIAGTDFRASNWLAQFFLRRTLKSSDASIWAKARQAAALLLLPVIFMQAMFDVSADQSTVLIMTLFGCLGIAEAATVVLGISGFHVGQILKLMDQAGNVLCGGHASATISGRLGYFSNVNAAYLNSYQIQSWVRSWLRKLEGAVNWAFYPMDGAEHCYRASMGETHVYKHGSTFNLLALSVLVFPVCLVIGCLARLAKAAGIPLPRTVPVFEAASE